MDTNNKGKTKLKNNRSSAEKGSECVSDSFLDGLKVLIVDDDPTCLKLLKKMLQSCLYEVTTCERAEEALSILRKRRFDIVLSDLYMPDMDGFKLLEIIGLEMDLPVVMMSSDGDLNVVMKGVIHGACDYLVKPIRIEAVRFIWQHVVRKINNNLKEMEQIGSIEDGGQMKLTNEIKLMSSRNEDRKSLNSDDVPTVKKPRLIWTPELHQKFVTAVNELGTDNIVPKKIFERMVSMDAPGVTRENIASHLQKYRLYLRRLNHGGNSTSPTESNSAQPSSLDWYNLHACATSSQFSMPSLAITQANGTEILNSNSSIDIPSVDQRNGFGSCFLESRYELGQPSSNDFENFHHEVLSALEAKQLVGSQEPFQVLGNNNLQVSGGIPNFQNFPSLLEDNAPIDSSTVCGGQDNSYIIQMAQTSMGMQMNGFPIGQHSSLPLSMQIHSNETEGQMTGEDVNTVGSNGETCYLEAEFRSHNFPIDNTSGANIFYGNEPPIGIENDDYYNLNLIDDGGHRINAESMADQSNYDPLLYVKHCDHDDILGLLNSSKVMDEW